MARGLPGRRPHRRGTRPARLSGSLGGALRDGLAASSLRPDREPAARPAGSAAPGSGLSRPPCRGRRSAASTSAGETGPARARSITASARRLPERTARTPTASQAPTNRARTTSAATDQRSCSLEAEFRSPGLLSLQMRRWVLAAGAAALLAMPTVLAFFSGGFFDKPRLVAALVAWALVVRRRGRLAAAAADARGRAGWRCSGCSCSAPGPRCRSPGRRSAGARSGRPAAAAALPRLPDRRDRAAARAADAPAARAGAGAGRVRGGRLRPVRAPAARA